MTAGPRGGAKYAFSASQLTDLERCERAWYLASVARAPDDATAGGQYLLQGDLFDEAVQLHSAKMDLEVSDLVANVRRKPGLRGAALTTEDEDWFRMAERAQRMLRATAHLLPPPKTAKVQHRYRVPVPGYEDRGGVVVTGALDLRRPGEVWDTKSTTDRGPGRGRDAKTASYALTDESTPGGNTRPLADNTQALLYAWCEFQDDPLRLSVRCTWVYASKPATGSPAGWAVSHVFLRPVVEAWFASFVRPRIDRMVDLHEASEMMLAPGLARANHDGCGRCFRRLSCDQFSGAQQPPKQPGAVTMPIDLKAIRAAQAARAAVAGAPAPAPGLLVAAAPDVLLSQLQASLAANPIPTAAEAIAEAGRRAALLAEAEAASGGTIGNRSADSPPHINRPDAPPNPNATGAAAASAVIDTEGVEAPAGSPPAVTPAPEPTTPRRRPGRPRKAVAAGATAETSHAPSAEADAPAPLTDDAAAAPVGTEELEALATAAQGIADAADSLVSRLNASLRERGVRL